MDLSQIEVIEVSRKPLDVDEYIKRSALESDFSRVISGNTLLVVNGVPSALYLKLDDWDFTELVTVLQSIEYQQSERTGGLKTTSRVFGFQPRVALRRDYCTATSLAYQDSHANSVVSSFAPRIEGLYREFFPAVQQKHAALASEKILPEWKIPNSAFTSGIINKNNPLKYHYDSGNFEDVCSCMLGFKRDIGGGYLAMPEFDLAFEVADNSLSIFDGQSILHGVTPLKRLTPHAYRYTIVFYTLKGMWNCEPLDAEIARIRKKKTERELKRAGILDEAIVDQHGEQK